MITYLILATIWLAISEYIFEVVEEEFSWDMKVVYFLFFPIAALMFIYNFIKNLITYKN